MTRRTDDSYRTRVSSRKFHTMAQQVKTVGRYTFQI